LQVIIEPATLGGIQAGEFKNGDIVGTILLGLGVVRKLPMKSTGMDSHGLEGTSKGWYSPNHTPLPKRWTLYAYLFIFKTPQLVALATNLLVARTQLGRSSDQLVSRSKDQLATN